MSSDSRRSSRKAILLRGIRESDLDELARIHAEEDVIAGTLQTPYGSPDVWKKSFDIYDQANRLIVAEIDKKIVGIGGLHLPPARKPRLRHTAYLGMAVDPAYHGRGVGKALLDALCDLADNWMGLLRLELHVFVDRPVAIRLYRSRGFHVEGIARAHALRGGKLVDSFYMARISKNVPWPRVTAEDATNPPLKQLPSPKKRNPNAN